MTAENRSAAKPASVASPLITSTFDSAMRLRSGSVKPQSISAAVSRATRWRIMSVVMPGPGPISKTSSPSSPAASIHGKRSVSSIYAHSRLERKWKWKWKWKWDSFMEAFCILRLVESTQGRRRTGVIAVF